MEVSALRHLRLSTLAAIPVFVSVAVLAEAACEHPAALPDTVGFASRLSWFADLPDSARMARQTAAAAITEPWLSRFAVRDGEVRRDLPTVLRRACLTRWRSRTYDARLMRASEILDLAASDMAAALALDPTQIPPRVGRGILLLAAGDVRSGVAELSCASALLDAADAGALDASSLALRRSLRQSTGWILAMAYRTLGLWDQAEETLSRLLGDGQRSPSGPGALVHGLCLAGRGQTADALDWAVRMSPLEYRYVSSNSSGMYARPGSAGNDWIKSQALLAAGDVDGARAALGDIDFRRQHTLPLAEAYWQDAGLVCELAGDGAASRCYERAHGRAPLWFARPTEATTAVPMVFGFPAVGVPFFMTEAGAFVGGSPFGYLAFQISRTVESEDIAVRDVARVRALDTCDNLLRRNIRPDVVHAMRARLHLATECTDQARPDLEFAHAAFARQGRVDPGTSQLLGLQELTGGRLDRARALLAEAVAAVPDNALGWRQLGVALAQAREYEAAQAAVEKGLALDPTSMEGWYNLGVVVWKRGDPAAALAHLEHAWKLDPGNERVQFMLQSVASSQRRTGAQGASEQRAPGDGAQ